MKSFIFLLIGLQGFLLVGCFEKKQSTKEEQNQLFRNKEDHVLEINNFAKVPKEIDCPPGYDSLSGYFALNKENFENGNFIYINRFGRASFISINGKIQRLERKLIKDVVDSIEYYVEANPEFEVLIGFKRTGAKANKNDWITGNLVVSNSRGNYTKKINFIGKLIKKYP